ncbi:uncharacterized protein LOC143541016 [Bidens hawaiensis]|uniref:uncharacterized protein LOC143541016 n=1 Tax=Bidens hawaiensis TaxID=980011 RepID=UPI00404B91FB
MNLLSLNVRGMGVEGKSDWCRSLRKENEINFLLIQESLCAGLEVSKIEKFWGKGNFGYEVVEPTGSIRNFLLITGTLKGSGERVNVLNIYASQKGEKKRRLWCELREVVNVSNGLWVMDGDFNLVRSMEERRNSRFNAGVAKDFNDFIFDAGLVEFGLKGGKFSYAMGNKLSRIDRILPRGKSDHNPILLKTFSCNYGPKPFRFFNSWMDREDFESVVLKVVKEFSFQGPPDIGLMLKFRCLRRALSAWRNESEAKEKEEENIIKEDLVQFEKELQVRDLVEEELWALEEGKRRISQLEAFRLRDLIQRARNRWAKEGDANSKFFHGLINRRRASYSIPGIDIKWGVED